MSLKQSIDRLRTRIIVAAGLQRMRYAFNEADHPRAADGRWGDKAGESKEPEVNWRNLLSPRVPERPIDPKLSAELKAIREGDKAGVASEPYVSPQEKQNRAIVEKLNNPKAKKLTSKQAADKAAKERRETLEKMTQSEVNDLAKSFGIDPAQYASRWNLHQQILANQAALLNLSSSEITNPI